MKTNIEDKQMLDEIEETLDFLYENVVENLDDALEELIGERIFKKGVYFRKTLSGALESMMSVLKGYYGKDYLKEPRLKAIALHRNLEEARAFWTDAWRYLNDALRFMKALDKKLTQIERRIG